MNKEDILGLLERATKPQEVQLLWGLGIRVSNGDLEFKNRVPKALQGKG